MLQKTLVFLILGFVAAEVKERFANPDTFGGYTYAVQQYSNSGPCYLIKLGQVGGLDEHIRRSQHFSSKRDCTKLHISEYGTELGEYFRTVVDTRSIQEYRNGDVCARNRAVRHRADLQLFYKADEWTNPPTIRVTPRQIRQVTAGDDEFRDDPCFDEIILYLPQGSTWTSKYVGAKETCRQLFNYEYRTIGWAEWMCERHPRCSGVYNPGCNQETFRLCDKFYDFSAAADTSKHCVYRKPVAQQCKWGDKVKGSIKSANVHRYTGMTITECKEKCEGNDLCKSIDFKQRSGGRGDCNLGNCRIGEGCTNDDDAEWVHYSCPKLDAKPCHNNRLTSAVEIRGNDVELNSLDASWNMSNAESLNVFFPECTWDQNQVKTHHWDMKNCKCGGAKCNQCGRAELCSEICSQAKSCKYVTVEGTRCRPKSSSNDRRAVSHHYTISGPPAPMCFVWTQSGIEQVTKDNKLGEYDQPKVNKPVSAKVQEIFFQNKYMETALKGKMIRKVGCAIEGQITNRAALVQPLWVAFVAVTCAVMQ
jgi:hypothetical protein